ncbi:MAG: Nramp family divalent metal transporter [Coprothermobacterota bacterium]|nr:Nramp family divalent metal transporter [Coprothermobacterota bacterium]
MRTNRLQAFWRSALLFFAVLGPGLVTGSVDNDAGGITTYSLLGAQHGYQLLWILIPSFVVLVIIQEMNARMGMVTGKGLADLIRENFGLRITLFILLALLFANLANTATEFAGIAGSLAIFGISKYITVPLAAILVWFLVVKGTYKSSEKIFLIFSLFLLSYVISAVMAKPDWNAVGLSLIRPSMDRTPGTVALVVGTIGTTIAPWMQFYMQSAVIEKGLTMKDYRFERWDVIIGSTATVVVAFFIVVACGATLYPNGIQIMEAKDAAVALQPLAGALASYVFAAGLFVASLFSATILPIATAFYICEAFGFEAGINKTWKEAPAFYGIFTTIMVISVLIILIPNAPLISITLGAQILNGVLLPVVLFSMIRLINRKQIMGQFTNRPLQNAIAYVTVFVLIGLTLVMLVLNIV